MKSVLYVAATLMIGASIYGFIDYSKTSRHKEFQTMYDENDVKTLPAVEEKKIPGTSLPEMTSKKETVETKKEPVKQPVKKIKKKRAIDVESFSRAPLREKEELIVLPEVKESTNKEQ